MWCGVRVTFLVTIKIYSIRNNLVICIKENGYIGRADSRTCDASRNYKLKSDKQRYLNTRVYQHSQDLE